MENPSLIGKAPNDYKRTSSVYIRQLDISGTEIYPEPCLTLLRECRRFLDWPPPLGLAFVSY
jgi:hypothetical protein